MPNLSSTKNRIFLSPTMTVERMSSLSITLDDGYVLRIELDEPRPEVKKIAVKELRETPEVTLTAIETLRQLLKDDPELTVPYENDVWLVRFLRPTKYFPDSAHKLIRHYYQFKITHKVCYDGLMPSREKNIFQNDILTVLPNRDQCGRRILILELGKKWNPDKVTLDEVFKGAVLFLEAAILEPETQICGASVIFDMLGLTMSQTTNFTPTFAGRIVNYLQDAVPIRLKNIHIINQPFIFKIVFALFKPLMRPKLRNRVIFHGDKMTSLHQYIDASCLPHQYGGTNLTIPRISGCKWYELMVKFDDEYAAINTYGLKNKK